jgi:hypothetical protein
MSHKGFFLEFLFGFFGLDRAGRGSECADGEEKDEFIEIFIVQPTSSVCIWPIINHKDKHAPRVFMDFNIRIDIAEKHKQKCFILTQNCARLFVPRRREC